MIARSYLYVPANNMEMLTKATTRGADAVIIDLEDSVSVAEKDLARKNLALWLKDHATSTQIWVRINSDELDKDLGLIDPEKVHGVIVPKADVENTAYVSGKCNGNYAVSALIESADSVLLSRTIAAIPHVSFLQIGLLDLRAELLLRDDSESETLKYALSHIVLASAAAGINQPIAPIFRDFNDLDGLKRSCKEFEDLGFYGRTCIHPKQIEAINQSFSTSTEELEKAHEVIRLLKGSSGATVDFHGRMIDAASARNARQIIKRHEGIE
jgi:citrate lyase subunit beta/citryl-CoA lyase